MAWIPAAIIGGSSIVGGLLGGSGSNQGSYNGVSGAYTPQGLQTADTAWQQAFGNEQGVANQVGSTVQPLYQQSLNAQQGIDYSQYLQGANQAGQAYSGLAGMAGWRRHFQAGQERTWKARYMNMGERSKSCAATAATALSR